VAGASEEGGHGSKLNLNREERDVVGDATKKVEFEKWAGKTEKRRTNSSRHSWRKCCSAEKIDVINGDGECSGTAFNVSLDLFEKPFNGDKGVVGGNGFLIFVFVGVELSLYRENR